MKTNVTGNYCHHFLFRLKKGQIEWKYQENARFDLPYKRAFPISIFCHERFVVDSKLKYWVDQNVSLGFSDVNPKELFGQANISWRLFQKG